MAYTPNVRPGVQNPSRYPSVGPNYSRYGDLEDQGWLYDYSKDKYYPDPKKQPGYKPPEKEPGMTDMLLPVAIGAGAIAGGKYVGSEFVPDLLSGAKDSIGGFLGIGGETAKTAASLATESGLTSGGVSGIGPVASGAKYGEMLASGPFDLGGIGSAGNAILPAAGLIGLGDVLMNNRQGGRGILQGAASGAAMGSYFGLPGAAIGAGIGGLIGFGQGVWGDQNRFETEWKRKKALFDKGLITEAELGARPTKGRSKEELIAEEEAKIAAGLPGNVEFARTRNESALTPTDIQGYATIIEKSSEVGIPRMELAQRALAAGAVREHHGTVDVDWSKVNLGADGALQPSALGPNQDLPSNMPGVPKVTPQDAAVSNVIKRSKTRSPGIDLQGNRISY